MTLVQDVIEPLYRKRIDWGYRIIASRKRASYVVALACTYLKGQEPTIKNVRTCVNNIRKLWIERLWELGRHELWMYQRGLLPDPIAINPDKILQAFKLYSGCRPRCIVYMPPQEEWQKHIKYKPCNKSNFCPHCWASVSARQTQRVRQIINAHLAGNYKANLRLDLHITERFLSSGDIGGLNFSEPADRYQALVRLRNELSACKRHLKKLVQRTRRNTLASVWRNVVIPEEQGWRVQLRQLFLTESPYMPPLDVQRGYRTAKHTIVPIIGGHSWKERRTVLPMDDDIYTALIAFNDYPTQLLTEDIELTAIYLNAAAKERMLGGTGKLQRVGSRLVREFVTREASSRNVKLGRV
jgi:hypothetical protein